MIISPASGNANVLLSITNGALNTGQQSQRVVRILGSKISVSQTQGTSPWIFQNNIFIHNSFFFHLPPSYRYQPCQLFETTTAWVYYATYTDVSLISYFYRMPLSIPRMTMFYLYYTYYPGEIYGTSCFRDCMLIPHELRVNCGWLYVCT